MDVKKWIDKTKQFSQEIKVELKKISWPQRKETISSTSVVLIIVLIIAFFLGIVDVTLSRIVNIFLS